MAGTSRFECASSLLRLGRILRETQRALWICFAVGIAAHVSLTGIRGLEAEQQAPKPLTTQFVKRQPRLTKPLELKKRPQPKQRRLLREMVSVRAKAEREERATWVYPVQIARSMAGPRDAVGRSVSLYRAATEPVALAERIAGAKETENVVDLSLEMMDPEALDTGEHHAVVIQDPSDKRGIRGFFHLAVAYSVNAARAGSFLLGSYYENPLAIPHLAEAMNRYTNIRTDVTSSFPFTSSTLFKTPFVYFCVSSTFVLTKAEARSLGKYMLGGGFFVADDGSPSRHGPANFTARRMLTDALAAVGLVHEVGWDFDKLPDSHPIYHCFFDFPNGPPVAGDYQIIRDSTGRGIFPPQGPYSDYLEGIVYNGRLIAIMSNKDFEDVWALQKGFIDNVWGERGLSIRALQFGVNMVVFALTQEGSITHRLMESIR